MTNNWISKWEIKGNAFLPVEQIESCLNLPKSILIGDTAVNSDSISAGLGNLSRLYLQYGFLATYDLKKIRQPDNQIKAVLHIREGKRLQVDNVQFVGNQFFDHNALLRGIDFRPNHTISTEKMDRYLLSALDLYANSGFPFVEISPSINLVDSGRLILIMKIVENGRYIVTDVQPLKEMDVNPETIRRQTGISLGRPFREKELREGERRLLNLPFINSVEGVDLLVTGEDSLTILIDLEEGKANRGEGIIGYIPRRGESDGYFNGYLKLKFDNLFGSARRFFIHWSKPKKKQEDFEVSYFEPWLLWLPISGEISFFRSIKDTIYTRTGGKLRFEASVRHNLTAFISGSASIGRTEQQGYALNDKSYGLEWGVRLDTRDYPINPGYGIDYEINWGLGRRVLSSDSTETKKKRERLIRLRLDHYLPISSRWVWFAGLTAHVYQDQEDIPYFDQFPLGGARSLRGYEEQQFRGERVVWTNQEIRYRLTQRSRAFIFLDAGQHQEKWEDPLIGYGLGVRLEAKVGLIGLDYGLGEGDSLNNGKLHFGLQNDF